MSILYQNSAMIICNTKTNVLICFVYTLSVVRKSWSTKHKHYITQSEKLFMMIREKTHLNTTDLDELGISKGHGVVTEESIRNWFKDLENYMESQDASDVLLDPKRIFNSDETSFRNQGRSLLLKVGKMYIRCSQVVKKKQ